MIKIELRGDDIDSLVVTVGGVEEDIGTLDLKRLTTAQRNLIGRILAGGLRIDISENGFVQLVLP